MRRSERANMVTGLRNEIKILEGSSFFVSDDQGNVAEVGPYGLFHKETRFLSRYWLELNGKTLNLLTSREVNYFSAAFF